MKTFTLILEEEAPTPVMRSLAKYLKSQGYKVPEKVNGGSELKIEGPVEKESLDLVLQNYIGSAQIKEVQESQLES